VIRNVVVQLWSGALVVQRLGHDDPDPSQADLDAWAVANTAANDGVRPAVRVLEVAYAGMGGSGGWRGPAGSTFG
jgi:hypothetical protein